MRSGNRSRALMAAVCGVVQLLGGTLSTARRLLAVTSSQPRPKECTSMTSSSGTHACSDSCLSMA